MGKDDAKGQTPTVETQQTEENQNNQEDKVTNLFNFKIKKISNEELVNECLMHLRFVEMGLLTPEHKTRALQLFEEATSRPQLDYIKNDFLVAIRVLKHL